METPDVDDPLGEDEHEPLIVSSETKQDLRSDESCLGGLTNFALRLIAAIVFAVLALIALGLLGFIIFVNYCLGTESRSEILHMRLGGAARIETQNGLGVLLGTKIEAEGFETTLSLGQVILRNVNVFNPEGSGYMMSHVLEAGIVQADLDMATFFTSFGQSVVIKDLIIRDAHFNVERRILASSSNVEEVLDFLFDEIHYLKGDDDGPSWVCLHALKLQNLTATVHLESHIGPMQHVFRTQEVALADLVYSDLNKTYSGTDSATKIAEFLLKTLLMQVPSPEDVGGSLTLKQISPACIMARIKARQARMIANINRSANGFLAQISNSSLNIGFPDVSTSFVEDPCADDHMEGIGIFGR
eukprot:TRINITY_DN42208_c0_g1_i1.p1 TRINITY_DN42208_c0_g1~~TRINITY_DN42208_c0_g1_i1.p1  ORF type:complete len:359 (-),score=63.69 TRINITY_DN42208_c0_g1_i1:71-1147(-)